VGYDHIDLRAAAERKIAIAYTPGVETDAVADLAMLLLLGASRRAYERKNSYAQERGSRPALPRYLDGSPPAKFSASSVWDIGQAVARRARDFGMKIHYYNPIRIPEETVGDAVFHADPLDLLRVSAFLSLNAPDSKETHHFLNAKTIQLLPPGAIVVNTARGGLIVDEELIAALQSGHVAAAGLDVFEGEPKLHPGYLALKNTFLLPHIGSATVETRTAMGMQALDDIDAVLNGNPASSLVTRTNE
jgi:lactate dehydrogenase-like 2-hydroxyacid dehydrogenase